MRYPCAPFFKALPPVGAALLAALVASSCGPDEAPSAANTSAAGRPVEAPHSTDKDREGIAARPQAPSVGKARTKKRRNFNPQRFPSGPAHPDLAATVNPANPADLWPSEHLALSAESILQYTVRALAAGAGAEALRGVMVKLPKGRVGDHTCEGAELLEAIRCAFAVPIARADDLAVEVEVLDVNAPDPAGVSPTNPAFGTTRAYVRIGRRPEVLGPLAAGPDGPAQTRQIEATVTVKWRIASRMRMADVAVDITRTADAPAAFRDVTLAVLKGEGIEEALALGALEAAGRTDKLVSFNEIFLGMHGLAVGDLDGNGFEDIAVGRAGAQPNLLFMNYGGSFREEAEARGFNFLESTGGFLILDLDGDGARDIAFGMGGQVAVSWNRGDGHFDPPATLSTEQGARVYSLSAADVDGDGDIDLYDTRYFRGGGYGAQAPTPYDDATNGAANVFWRNLLVDGESSKPRAFRDDTEAVGLDVENDRFSLSSVFDDFDRDGLLDLYVTNDFGRNTLYLWRGTRFESAAKSFGLVDKAAGMGVSVADVDLDGHSDLVVSNMHSSAGMRVTKEPQFQGQRSAQDRLDFMRHSRGNTLFRGTESGRFEDVTDAAGASRGGWAWGARFVDWNRDGLMDIVVPNGFLSGRSGPDLQSFFWRRVVGASPLGAEGGGSATGPELDRYLAAWGTISYLSQFARQHWNALERTYTYTNKGGFRFEDDSLLSGIGFADDSRALAEFDYDQDGRLDLVVRNRTSPIVRVLQGTAPLGHWTAFRLVQPGPNGDAVGAAVRIMAGGIPRTRRVSAGDGFLAGSTLEQHFGLGEAGAVTELEVTWPGGTKETFDVTPGGTPLAGGAWRLERGRGSPILLRGPGTSRPGLSAKPPAVLASGTPGPERLRVPLIEEIPLGALRIPSFTAGPTKVRDLAGPGGLALIAWTASDPKAKGTLEAAVRCQDMLRANASLAVATLALDGVREEDAARAMADSAGAASFSGRADGPAGSVIELILARTLSPYEDLPLPIVFLFDAQGDLTCLQVGGFDPGLLEADAQRLAGRGDPSATEALINGRWTGARPTRSVTRTVEWLSARGFDELARDIDDRSKAPR